MRTELMALLAAYLIGAVPFGLIAVRLAGGGDIRRSGSGNIGATNAFRAGGKAAGIATLALDIGKGVLAIAVARMILGPPDPGWESAAAFAAVAGHCFPVFLGFKGGKGIATGCGAYGTLAPIPMAGAVALFLGVMLATRMVSAGSIAAGVALPLLMIWHGDGRPVLVSVAAAALLVIVRHHANIRRILAGGERRLGAP